MLLLRNPITPPAGPPPAPQPCTETCLICGSTTPCPGAARLCAPICAHTRRPHGPRHVCIATTRIPARLIVRPTYGSATYTTPWGETYKPRPTLYPWLVVDSCPRCGRPHWHTITTPERRWYRVAPCGLPYVLTLGDNT